MPKVSALQLSFLLTAGLAPLHATAAEAIDAAALDEVVVTATRAPTPITAIPSTVRVIDREALQTQLAVSPSLLDSLSFSIPSFAPGRQKMTSTGESLRGRTPLYLVDGIPQSTPLRDGKRSGFTIDPAFVDRIEVIYGANAIQGVGATGGVINYVTIAPPKSGAWLNRLTAELATDDFEANGLHYKTSLASISRPTSGSSLPRTCSTKPETEITSACPATSPRASPPPPERERRSAIRRGTRPSTLRSPTGMAMCSAGR